MDSDLVGAKNERLLISDFVSCRVIVVTCRISLFLLLPFEEDGPETTSTKTYLRGELVTYSDKTLELYYNHICDCLNRGENPMKKRALAMLAGAGFDSLEEAEAAEAKISGGLET